VHFCNLYSVPIECRQAQIIVDKYAKQEQWCWDSCVHASHQSCMQQRTANSDRFLQDRHL